MCESRFRLSGSHGIITMTHNHDMHVITFVCAKRILNLAIVLKGFPLLGRHISGGGEDLFTKETYMMCKLAALVEGKAIGFSKANLFD